MFHILIIFNLFSVVSGKTSDLGQRSVSVIISSLSISSIPRVVVYLGILNNIELYIKDQCDIIKPTLLHLVFSPLNYVGTVSVDNYGCLQELSRGVRLPLAKY